MNVLLLLSLFCHVKVALPSTIHGPNVEGLVSNLILVVVLEQ
jgi:hypothetical protein